MDRLYFRSRRWVFMPGSALGASTEGISQSYCSNFSCASAILIASEVRPHFVQKCSLVPGFHLIRCSMWSPCNQGGRREAAPFSHRRCGGGPCDFAIDIMKAVMVTSNSRGACRSATSPKDIVRATKRGSESGLTLGGLASSDRNECCASHHTTDRTILRSTTSDNWHR
jgi:hypothetical protein